MKKSEVVKAIQEVLREKKRPGLWANIRAKRAKGEKPAHKNSNAHKDAVAAGKKIKEGEAKSPEELESHIKALSKARAQAASKGQTTLLNSYHKEISKAQKQLKKLTQTWPKTVTSRYGDEYEFRLIKVMPDRAKYEVVDLESGKVKGTQVYGSPDSLKAAAAVLIKPQGGRQSSQF